MNGEPDTSQYRSIRTYGEVLLVALLVLHGAAFGAYRWMERNEVRSELIAVARDLPAAGFGQHSTQITRYPEGIVVARRVGTEYEPGFSEETIAGQEHIVYTVPGTDVIVAKPVADLDRESLRFGAILATLFAAEAIILVGWWLFVREKLREMFTV